MEKITPFDIPLLQEEICHYLTRKDLYRCTLVSKAWFAWFSPILWRDLDDSRKIPSVDALTRWRNHIRTASLSASGPVCNQLPFLHLDRLELVDNYEPSHVMLRVLKALQGISTLRHLKISLQLDSELVYQQWIRTLPSLSHLEGLDLIFNRFVNGRVIQGTLSQCHTYDYLRLGYSAVLAVQRTSRIQIEEERKIYRAAKAAIRRIPEMNLRELSFRINTEFCEDNILQPLLERCPRMERLNLGYIKLGSTMQHLTKVIKENKLPRLRCLHSDIYNGGAFAEMLSHLKNGLVSLIVHGCLDQPFTQSLIQHHCLSLTKLDLKIEADMEVFSNLMAGLPKLRHVRAVVGPKGDIRRFNVFLRVTVSTTHAFHKQWACVDLKILELRLDTSYACGTIDDAHWRDSGAQNDMDYVFSEVSKLRNLEELSLGSTHNDLYLKRHGFLSQLATLKHLKSFDLQRTPAKEFGALEARWMIKSWPKLLHVYDQHAPRKFKKTLLAKRPHIFVDNDHPWINEL